MIKPAYKWIIIIIVVLAVILLIWGLIGGGQAQAVGKTCDMGIGNGETFCWTWHTNAIGQMQEGIDNLFGNP
jgi:hypothetical protein